MNNTAQTVLSMEGVSFGYTKKALLQDFSFRLGRGEFVCIAGANGCGKSTLLRLASGQLQPLKGTVQVNGKDLRHTPPREAAKSLAVVPQQVGSDFPYTVWELAAMGRSPYLNRLGFETETDQQAISQALEAAGLSGFENRSFGALSGGEQQRVFLARALAQQAEILLLDEPTSALDPRHTAEFFNVLRTLRSDRGQSVVMVTHDLNQAQALAERFILLGEGRILADGSANDVLVPETLEAVYGTGFNAVRIDEDRQAVFPDTRTVQSPSETESSA